MPVQHIPKKPPTGLARIIWRLPIWLFRLRINWILGSRFLLLRHTGRVSGLPRANALEVVEYDRDTDTYYVVSAWGEQADWYKNVVAHPEVTVRVSRREFAARARFVPPAEAEEIMARYARENPRLARNLPRVAGYRPDGTEAGYREIGRMIKFVGLRPSAPKGLE
ncbi:MAG: nitroreductase family deazaflavin-dependent oxidoreductase [Anaerolineales bacterium]